MAGGDFSLNNKAADTTQYPVVFPGGATAPIGRGNGSITTTNFNDGVQALTPDVLTLGQIVVYEFEIDVTNSSTADDSISFTHYWDTHTSNGSDFGYDENSQILGAFVDTSDPTNFDPDGDATVSFSSALIDIDGDGTDDIVGTFDVSGLDANDNVVVEVWVALEDELPAGSIGGVVQSGFIDAKTEAGDTINVGKETIQIQKLNQFDPPPPLEPSLAVDKRFIRYVDRDGSGDLSAGDRAVYRIFVTNDGEVDLDGVEVTDSLASGPLTLSDRAGDGVDVLAVGDTENARFVYTVTADDVAAGKIVNTGTADSNQTDPLSDMEMVGLPKPELAIDKFYKGFVDKDGNGLVTQGDILQFGITVSSTGTANLTDVSVVDELVGLDETIDLLEAGDSQTFHVTYKVTDEDALTGKVTNIAIGNSDQTGPEDDMEMVDVVIGANIDIKPGSFPSSFNLKGGGIVPVAIFGSEILDFGNDPIMEACLSEYAPGPAMGEGCTSNFNYEDINGDGYLDALAKFGKSSLRGVLDGDSTFAQLTGETQAGLSFVAVGDVNVVG